MGWEKRDRSPVGEVLEGETVWAVARRQHGVVTRRQLLALGLSSHSIDHRLGNGRLHWIRRGVYAVGRRELSPEGRWLAAVLTCGAGAVLSHGSAAALWGFGREDKEIAITVRNSSTRSRSGIWVHSRPRLSADEVTVRRGVPVANPVLTFIGLARHREAHELERAVSEADRLGLIDPEALLAALAGHREQGVWALRDLLDAHTFRLTDSELERRFLRLVREVGLPLPLTGHRLNGFLVDFYWPDLGLVVETDGIRYHRTPAQQARDRRRDQTHTVSGLTQLRFTHAQVTREANHVRSVLKKTVGRLQRERPFDRPQWIPAA